MARNKAKAPNKSTSHHADIEFARDIGVLRSLTNTVYAKGVALDLDSARSAVTALEQYKALIGKVRARSASNPAKLEAVNQVNKDFNVLCGGITKSKLEDRIKVENQKLAKKLGEIAAKERIYAAANDEITKLLPKLASIVTLYEKAKLEDKTALHQQFISARIELNTRMDLLPHSSERASFATQLQELNRRMNVRTKQLDAEEVRIQEFALKAAKEATAAVDKMSAGAQLLALAPPHVAKALKQLLAKVSTAELQAQLAIASGEKSLLVTKAVNEALLAITASDSEVGAELTVVSSYSLDDQVALVQSLLSGKETALSESASLALLATVVDQLAATEGVKAEDRVAIQNFAKDLVANMAKIESGKAKFLSVLVAVKNEDGVSVVRGFHLSLEVLMKDPTKFAAGFAVELLRIGATEKDTFLTQYTSLPEVVKLMAIQGKELSRLQIEVDGVDQLAIEDQTSFSLVNIVSKALSSPITTKGVGAITDGTTSSDTALVAAAQKEIDLVNSRIFGDMTKSSANVDILGIVRAIAILGLTVTTVLAKDKQMKNGITSTIGNAVIALPIESFDSSIALIKGSNVHIKGSNVHIEDSNVHIEDSTAIAGTPLLQIEEYVSPKAVIEENGQAQVDDTTVTLEDTSDTVGQTAGTVAQTAGTVAQTGGTVAQTGGTVAQTGGTVAQTGGTVAQTGGTVGLTAGVPLVDDKEPADTDDYQGYAAGYTKSPSKPEVNEKLVDGVKAMIDELSKLDRVLNNKYYGKAGKGVILKSSEGLLINLKEALKEYTVNGNDEKLKKSCVGAIQLAKKEFNTHRDHPFFKFLGDLKASIAKLFSAIFSKENSDKDSMVKNRASFFESNKPQDRVTNSAKVLFDVKSKFEKVIADVENEDDEHETQLRQGGYK